MQPLVSIIIPTYNRAHLIGETLDSILAQTYQNWECIVVDDGSTDDTDALMAEYMAKDSRFRYYHRPKDRLPGGNAARNYGFEVSKGEYIQWFDSDDLMCPKHIQKKIETFMTTNNSIDFTYCGFVNFGGENEKKIKNIEKADDLIKCYIEKKILLNLPTFMYNKEAIDIFKFDESLTRAQDLDFCFRFLSHKKRKGEQIKEVLIHIREHRNRITAEYHKNKKMDVASELEVRKQILKYAIDHYRKAHINLALKYYLITLGKAMKKKYFIIFFSNAFIVWRGEPFIMIKINLIGLLYMFFGKGEFKYKKIYEKL